MADATAFSTYLTSILGISSLNFSEQHINELPMSFDAIVETQKGQEAKDAQEAAGEQIGDDALGHDEDMDVF